MITKKKLVSKVAKNISGLNCGEVSIVVDELLDTILSTLKSGEEIYLAGFGKFGISEFKETIKRIPNGKEIVVPAHKEPKFKFFKTAKEEF